MSANEIRPGDFVSVISGPHQGRTGHVVQTRDIAVDNRDPEPYAVIEYREENCFKEVQTDHISVPARRCALRR